MLKIWGRVNSINVQKVLICVEDLGLAYDRSDVGGAFGGNDTADYLAMNPNGRVPTIEDDGFVLWESNAIVRYLSRKHDLGEICPADPIQNADADRWMDWQATMLTPAMHQAFWGLIRTAPEDQDAAVIEASRKASVANVQILDTQLAGRSYVTGDSYTIGDIPVAAAVHRWFNLPIERPAVPNVQAWYERIMQRPSASKILTSPIT
jgi:glutathione S-transferase